ncbi:hypothetical protein [Serratia sp. (in: enterobacteria)]|uniref:hypothetical protein n=1 Tax=Serratia sp. (in: enterobacteria) TaxID=616 RepID=UPI002897FD0F|nr:hypothetical protein [Serratia sp. (in: enterobacteria)]
MTLTTDRQQFESWFTKKYPRSNWGVMKTASGEYQGGLTSQLWEVWQESRACLANREAQPVAYLNKFSGTCMTLEQQPNAADDAAVYVPLYTAPPAPAIPDIGSSVVNDAAWKLHDTLTKYGPINGHQFNHLKSCLYEALKVVMTDPPAPAYPERLPCPVHLLPGL